MLLTISNENNFKIPPHKTLQKAGETALRASGQPVRGISANLLITDKKTITKLNKDFRNKNKPTDVLSFRGLGMWRDRKINKKNYAYDYDPSTKTVNLGDIVVCVPIAEEQAKEYNHSLDQEITELFIHGMLHLLGYDHESNDEAEVMKSLEELIIRNIVQ